MKLKLFFPFCVSIIFLFLAPWAQAEQETSPSPPPAGKLKLIQAEMCEDLKDRTPQGTAVVFSVSIGKILCFTSFDPVPEKTVIYHSWYFRDKLITKIGLSLQPPKWSTVSSIQLREADKGPWRVEVSDQVGHTFRILRFSVTD
jgi:hypothetical protein